MLKQRKKKRRIKKINNVKLKHYKIIKTKNIITSLLIF